MASSLRLTTLDGIIPRERSDRVTALEERTPTRGICFSRSYRMRISFRLLTAAALVASAQSPLGAQLRSNWSVQASGLFSDFNGNSFTHINSGWGLELQARRRITRLWSVGCGFQGTYHAHRAPTGDVRFEGGFCEPRKAWAIKNDNLYPYIGLRGAFVHRRDTNNDSTSFDAAANGWTTNLGAGIMVPVGAKTARFPFLIDLGGSVGYASFNDLVDQPDQVIVATRAGGHGVMYMLRAGVAVGLLAGHP